MGCHFRNAGIPGTQIFWPFEAAKGCALLINKLFKENLVYVKEILEGLSRFLICRNIKITVSPETLRSPDLNVTTNST